MVRDLNTHHATSALHLFKLKGEGMPSQVSDILVPTKELRSTVPIVRDAEAINATVTMYTTDNDPEKDFYLSGYQIQLVQFTTLLFGFANIRVRIDGAIRQICTLTNPTGTVGHLGGQHSEIGMPITPPIKIDKNTTITLESSGDANTIVDATIFGFYE